MKRRAFLAWPLLLAVAPARGQAGWPAVTPGRALSFPRDHGTHNEAGTEWWYDPKNDLFMVWMIQDRALLGEYQKKNRTWIYDALKK